MNYPPPGSTPPPPPPSPAALAAGWYPDPLDQQLRRYFDGARWTFWTRDSRLEPVAHTPVAAAAPTQPAQPKRRDDIAAAVAAARNLLGAGKELNQLEQKLYPDETVLAVASAVCGGTGVLAVTTHRILFSWIGVLKSVHLESRWLDVGGIHYDPAQRRLTVVGKPTGRKKYGQPLWTVQIRDRKDTERLAAAARQTAAAPRLDIR
ncbi:MULTISPECIES: DUF2510 domain-containing protein [Nocardioides]|uniref:DUF2510 domain-containing protein n=1 Tax=Nocardioides vastitatis TaxID=2568655 RepID=A0ABW0ZSP8_9ACTN|nr:DUF2510 domain-containing protein [Nocardioides sp.]THJ05734.1 DUF2510 domain-containing protein [Nocardioides sp.]